MGDAHERDVTERCDYVELRLDGGRWCGGGAADLEGDLPISNHVTWTSPAALAYIESDRIVDRWRGLWSPNVSIATTLVVIDRSGSINQKFGSGWFHDIELEVDGEHIFADGFEPTDE